MSFESIHVWHDKDAHPLPSYASNIADMVNADLTSESIAASHKSFHLM